MGEPYRPDITPGLKGEALLGNPSSASCLLVLLFCEKCLFPSFLEEKIRSLSGQSSEAVFKRRQLSFLTWNLVLHNLVVLSH